MFFRIEDLFKKEEQQLVTEETDTAKKDKAEDVEIKDTVPSQTEQNFESKMYEIFYAVFDCGFIRRLLFKVRLQFAFKQQSPDV